MNSKGLGADFVYAWPEAEIDVMGKRSQTKSFILLRASLKTNQVYGKRLRQV